MKAVKYRVKISIDAVHSWGNRLIEEIFIPQSQIIINNAGGLFFNDEARSDKDVIEIDILDEQVRILEKHLEKKAIVEEVRSELFYL